MYAPRTWQERIASVDRVIEGATSVWAINYWTVVRRQLVRKMLNEKGMRVV